MDPWTPPPFNRRGIVSPSETITKTPPDPPKTHLRRPALLPLPQRNLLRALNPSIIRRLNSRPRRRISNANGPPRITDPAGTTLRARPSRQSRRRNEPDDDAAAAHGALVHVDGGLARAAQGVEREAAAERAVRAGGRDGGLDPRAEPQHPAARDGAAARGCRHGVRGAAVHDEECWQSGVELRGKVPRGSRHAYPGHGAGQQVRGDGQGAHAVDI